MGRTDWEKLKALSDEEIEARALSDPDALPITDEMWATRRIVMPDARPKVSITLRVDERLVDFFKAGGPGYQGRMHAVLEHYATRHGMPTD